MNEPIRVALVGLGRLGIHYAENIIRNVDRAELVAICSLNPEEINAIKLKFEIQHSFTDYDEMLEKTSPEAVVVVSSTPMHGEHIIKALHSGAHVFCEKPLAFTSEICRDVEKVAAHYPDQVVMVGFNRRYDPSYRYAWDLVNEGKIGKPFLVRSQTVDMDTVAEFQLKFAKKSGGIFIDYNVHDIDLVRWFLDSEIHSVWSLGDSYKFPRFGEVGDADFVMSMCSLENGAMAVIGAGRTATHGHDTYTEITGTEGTLRIGRPAIKNLVEIYDRYGMRKEGIDRFWERFEDGFLLMIVDFIDCIVENRKSLLTLENARRATEVAQSFIKSYREGGLVHLVH